MFPRRAAMDVHLAADARRATLARMPVPAQTPVITDVPALGSLERWAYDYIVSVDLAEKLAPRPAPHALEPHAPVRRIPKPGRPASLGQRGRPRKTPSVEALRSPARRAELAHTFLHHELQAAKLFCWALLAFPDTPPAFRRGLARIAVDETRHMRLYADYLASLGYEVGAFPVHDWFWERIPAAADPASFVAVMGVGFEGANLNHVARFSERFRAAGDVAGAEIIERIGHEELAHVRFAVRWFTRFTGGLDFDSWCAALPRPLSPFILRGKPLARAARLRAGLDVAFVDALEAWRPQW